MKVLFVKPPLPRTSFISRFAVCEPLEFAVLAANLLDIADMRLLDLRLDQTTFRTTIEEFEPDVICFTALTMDVPVVRDLCQTARESASGVTICIGGEHATFMPDSFLDVADHVFMGRSIQSFRQFLVALGDTSSMRPPPRLIPGDSKHIFLVPHRRLHKRYQSKYVYGAMFDIALATFSVGCPFRCTYCSVPGSEPKHLIDTIDHALASLESAPTNNILYTDSNFLANRPAASELLGELARHPRKFEIMVSFRSDTIVNHPYLADQLANAGVKVGAMGLESLDDEQLSEWNKRASVDENSAAVDILHRSGIMVRGNFVISQDFDDLDFYNLQQYIDGLQIEFPTFQILTPLPGSLDFPSLFARCVVRDFRFFDLSHSVLPVTRLSARSYHQQFKELFSKSYSISKLARLTPKLPARAAARGAWTALTSRIEMTYDGQDEFFEYHH